MSEFSISDEEVERVARLARLSVAPERRGELRSGLAAILEYVRRLDELDIRDVEATMHPVSPQCPLREDRVLPGCEREEVLAQAPASREGGFSVPRVLEVEG